MEYEIQNNTKIIVNDSTIDVIQEGLTVLSFPIITEVNPTGGKDWDQILSKPVISGNHVEWTAVSFFWSEKQYLLDIYPDGFYYRVRVRGKGNINNIQFEPTVG